jgi:hypothetical protein
MSGMLDLIQSGDDSMENGKERPWSVIRPDDRMKLEGKGTVPKFYSVSHGTFILSLSH